MDEVFLTHSAADTARVAHGLAARFRAGAVVLLSGELGAGKTTFVKGLAEGLGLDPAEVSSPTFTLVQEYRGSRTLYHVDLYRLTEREIPDLGLDELFESDAVIAVEWPERLRDGPLNAVRVKIEDLGENERRVTIRGAPSAGERFTQSGSSVLPL